MPNKEPPREHRFKPGHSGNPKGKAKGTLSLKTFIQKVWSEEITDDKGNSKIKALLSIKAMVDKAESGDVSAFKALAERIEGLPKQEIEQTHVFAKMPSIEIDGKKVEYDIGV